MTEKAKKQNNNFAIFFTFELFHCMIPLTFWPPCTLGFHLDFCCFVYCFKPAKWFHWVLLQKDQVKLFYIHLLFSLQYSIQKVRMFPLNILSLILLISENLGFLIRSMYQSVFHHLCSIQGIKIWIAMPIYDLNKHF